MYDNRRTPYCIVPKYNSYGITPWTFQSQSWEALNDTLLSVTCSQPVDEERLTCARSQALTYVVYEYVQYIHTGTIRMYSTYDTPNSMQEDSWPLFSCA